MSGSSGPSKKQLQLQSDTLEEQKRANSAQIKYLELQTKALGRNQVPSYVPPAPPPTPGTANSDSAVLEARIRAKSRFGYGRTVLGGAQRAY